MDNNDQAGFHAVEVWANCTDAIIKLPSDAGWYEKIDMLYSIIERAQFTIMDMAEKRLPAMYKSES